jgi:sugar phosphate permease
MGEAGAFPNSCGVISRWFPNQKPREVSLPCFLALMWRGDCSLDRCSCCYRVWLAYDFLCKWIDRIDLGACMLFLVQNNPSEVKGVQTKKKNILQRTAGFKPHHSLNRRSALKNRNLFILAIAFLCSQWGNYFFLAWMPVYLQEGKHFSEHEMKMTSFCVFITGVMVVLSVGIVSDWLVKKRDWYLAGGFSACLPREVRAYAYS